MRKHNPPKAELIADYEAHIQALIKSDFCKEKAAKILGVTRKTIYNRFKKFKKAGLHKTTDVV